MDRSAPITRRSADSKAGAGTGSDWSFGTLAGNKWLVRHGASLPVRLPESAASRMIAAMPHPQDPRRGAMIYTARTAAGVEGLNGIAHGGQIGYLWAEGQQVVKRGRYVERGVVYVPDGQK